MITADLIIQNAVVLTLDADNKRAGSVAVHEGKIVGVWKEPTVPESDITNTSNTQIIDAKGATLIPGFVDTHNHIYGYSQALSFVNCSTPLNKSISDVLQRLQDKAKQTPINNWVKGQGYDDTALLEKRHITREELDLAVPDHPVSIMHISGHLSVVNSAALEMAGIDETITDPPDGYFGRNAEGRLNGLLFEKTAISYITKVLPMQSEEEMLEAMAVATNHYLAEGITTNTEAVLGMSGNLQKELNVFINAANQLANPLRSRLMLIHTELKDNGMYAGRTADEIDQAWSDATNGMVRLDSAKLFQDGSLQALTGALREAYYSDLSVYGDLFEEQDAFNNEILNLHNRGFRIAVHGNGDKAIGSIIDAYEHALETSPKTDHHHRIEHVQTAKTEDIEKMATLNIAGSFFINHVYYWGERHRDLFLGPERAERISPLADAVNNDLLFTLHSDCPVTPISPLFSIWAAVNRITDKGNILGPEQRIDVVTALKSMTIYGAELNFDAHRTGSIEKGKLADFALLDKDPTTIDPMKIKDINVLSTIISGNIAYEKEESLLT